MTNPGMVTAEIAKSFAENEFEKFRVVQDRMLESDFDKEIENQRLKAQGIINSPRFQHGD